MIHPTSLRHAVLVELEHSSGASTAKIVAIEPGVYRLYVKTAEKVESATVSIGKRNQVLEQSSGSRVRFTAAVEPAARKAARHAPLEAA